MIERRSPGQKSLTVLNYAFITLLSLVCLYPLVHVLFASFSDPIRLVRHRGLMLGPQGFSLRGYQTVFNNPNILQGYMNTLIYVVAGTALNMFLTPLGAYALARQGWPFRKFFDFMFVFTMYFSVGIVPAFMLVKSLGLLDTRWAIIISVDPPWFSVIALRIAASVL